MRDRYSRPVGVVRVNGKDVGLGQLEGGLERLVQEYAKKQDSKYQLRGATSWRCSMY